MISKEARDALNSPMPQSWVKHREGGGGKALSFAEGWQIIDEMNQIFGPGAWGYDTAPILVVDEERDGSKGKRWHVTYNCKCVLTVYGPNRESVTIGDWGTGHGIDKDRGVAHESAIKEACTDSTKRAAKSLGRRLGLALYDKEQRHVEQEPQPVSREAAGLIEMLTTNPERARVLVKDMWSKFGPADRAALKEAIEAGKQKAA